MSDKDNVITPYFGHWQEEEVKDENYYSGYDDDTEYESSTKIRELRFISTVGRPFHRRWPILRTWVEADVSPIKDFDCGENTGLHDTTGLSHRHLGEGEFPSEFPSAKFKPSMYFLVKCYQSSDVSYDDKSYEYFYDFRIVNTTKGEEYDFIYRTKKKKEESKELCFVEALNADSRIRYALFKANAIRTENSVARATWEELEALAKSGVRMEFTAEGIGQITDPEVSIFVRKRLNNVLTGIKLFEP